MLAGSPLTQVARCETETIVTKIPQYRATKNRRLLLSPSDASQRLEAAAVSSRTAGVLRQPLERPGQPLERPWLCWMYCHGSPWEQPLRPLERGGRREVELAARDDPILEAREVLWQRILNPVAFAFDGRGAPDPLVRVGDGGHLR